MTNWGLVANGAYVPGIEKVPSNIYYKQVTDPEHPDRKVLDIVGIDEYGPVWVVLPVTRYWSMRWDGEC